MDNHILQAIRQLHEYIFLPLMVALGWLLQLKYIAVSASPFVTDCVSVRAFIVVFVVYFGALTTKMFSQTPSSHIAEFMTNVTILSGTLASILLLLILFPVPGWFALVLWLIYLVRDVVTKKSYKGTLIHVFGKVKLLVFGPSEESDVPPPPIQNAAQHNVEEREMEDSNGKEPRPTPLPDAVSESRSPRLPVCLKANGM